MSSLTTAAHRRNVRPPPAWSVAHLLARPWGANLGWFWLTMAVVTVGGVIVVQLVTGEVTASVWAWLLDAPKYYLGATGILLTSSLPMFVGNGVTRRDTIVGMQVVIVGASLASAIMTAVFFGVEAVVFDQFGWSRKVVTDHLFTSGTQSLVVIGESILLYLGWMLTGHLVALGYKRWGGRWGTAALPLTLAPGVAVQVALDVGSAMGPSFGWADDVPVVISVVLAVAAILAASVGSIALGRGVSIQVARA